MKKNLLLLLLCYGLTVFGQAGLQLETTYGVGGVMSLPNNMTLSGIGSDEKTYFSYNFSDPGPHGLKLECRLDTGELDTTFGSAGTAVILPTGFYVVSVVQHDDYLYLYGTNYTYSDDYYNGYLARITLDGTLDTTFGNNGFFRYNFWNVDAMVNVFFLNDGKLICQIKTFYNTYAFIRLNADGTLDTTFGDQNLNSLTYKVLNIYPDSNIISSPCPAGDGSGFYVQVSGKDYYTSPDGQTCIVKVDNNFNIDGTFGDNGRLNVETALDLPAATNSSMDRDLLKMENSKIYFKEDFYFSDQAPYSAVLCFDPASGTISHMLKEPLTSASQYNSGIVDFIIDSGTCLTLTYDTVNCFQCTNPGPDIHLNRYKPDGTVTGYAMNLAGSTLSVDYGYKLTKFSGDRVFLYGRYSCYLTGSVINKIATAMFHFDPLKTDWNQIPSLVATPNPVENVATISFPFAPDGTLTVEWFDTKGQKVKSGIYNPEGKNLTFNVSGLSTGIYILKAIDSGGKQYQMKLIKK